MNSISFFILFLTFLNFTHGKAVLDGTETKVVTASNLKDQFDDENIQIAVFDFRSNFSRETEGFIQSSFPVPESIKKDSVFEDSFDLEKSILIVVVADEVERADEAEVILRGLGYSNFERYLDGMEKWREVGGQIEIPKGITFKALNKLLADNAVLLIDVRNRTEFNKVGQIPGSFCLPLHEVESAMTLSTEKFEEKYAFPRPEPEAKNVVLTCGSGVRAGFADTIMQRFGYQHLRIYHGSFDDWREKKGEVVPANFVIDYDN